MTIIHSTDSLAVNRTHLGRLAMPFSGTDLATLPVLEYWTLKRWSKTREIAAVTGIIKGCPFLQDGQLITLRNLTKIDLRSGVIECTFMKVRLQGLGDG